MAKSSNDDFMGLFWNLSNPNDEVRISASEKMVTELKQCQEKYQVQMVGRFFCRRFQSSKFLLNSHISGF